LFYVGLKLLLPHRVEHRLSTIENRVLRKRSSQGAGENCRMFTSCFVFLRRDYSDDKIKKKRSVGHVACGG
jgi:hypothetical protein